MEFKNDIFKNLSPEDYFWMCARMLVTLAIVDDFEENEIRCLSPLNPVPLQGIRGWDRLLKKKEPVQGDLGMNKERKTFHFRNGIWKPIKNIY